MRALISVADKDGIEAFARELSARGYEIIATEGTASVLRDASVPVRTVSEVTGVPELLGGRVKTLHPAIHSGILARRDDAGDMAQLQQEGIAAIDMVVCNLMPSAGPVAREAAGPGSLQESLAEQIDIGGAALVRAAAKNYRYVTVVVRPRDYPEIQRQLDEGGSVMVETRQWLAALAFQHTATYDTLVAERLRSGTVEGQFPEEVTIPLQRLRLLRYGENPHQQAALYGLSTATLTTPVSPGTRPEASRANGSSRPRSTRDTQPERTATVASATLLHGKELGFNNVLDLDAALATVASFVPPAAVIVKHTNPCGLACGDGLLDAYRRAHAGDTVSAYGGVVGFNREVDEATALELSQIFYEAVLAPGFAPAALEVLRKNPDLRLLATGVPIGPPARVAVKAGLEHLDAHRVSGGILLQTPDIISDQDLQRTVVTEREPTLEEVTDLLFAWKAVQRVKSNAIVLAKKLMLVGVGAGQTNRLFSVEIAVQKAQNRARGSVLASDAYFPFPDGVEAACKAGVTAIIQPGGSARDAEVIRMANRYGVAMVVTGQRHFRH